jgi:hypothetical protein
LWEEETWEDTLVVVIVVFLMEATGSAIVASFGVVVVVAAVVNNSKESNDDRTVERYHQDARGKNRSSITRVQIRIITTALLLASFRLLRRKQLEPFS